jgi:multimeric flavodoxin WrbA
LPVKILGINGSPRKYGGTARLLEVALEAARRAGGDVERVDLYDYRIEPCRGCLSDVQEACKPPCIVEDDFRKLLPRILAADGIIFATPVYWYAPSGMLKNLIDRMTVLENMALLGDKSWLEGKVVGAIAVGQDSGEIMAISYLLTTLNSMGAVVPPWALAYSRMGEKVLEDLSAVMDAANVGLIVYIMARVLKEAGPESWYNPRLEWLEEYIPSLEARMEEERKKYADRIREFELFSRRRPSV